MPRKFTPREEQEITRALREAGRTIMGSRGVRKTSIDDLVRSAGISKGSFYRFYQSKEALALEVLAEWERDFHAGIEERFRLTAPRGSRATAALLSRVILEDFPRRMMESGMQGLFDPEEIAHLTRTAEERERRIMDEQDLRLFARLRPLFLDAGLEPAEDEKVIIAGLRIIFEAGAGVLRSAGTVASLPSSSATAMPPLEPHHFQQGFAYILEGFLDRVFH